VKQSFVLKVEQVHMEQGDAVIWPKTASQFRSTLRATVVVVVAVVVPVYPGMAIPGAA
jgi:hypothetical protein